MGAEMTAREVAVTALRLGLGGVFVYAGLDKVAEPRALARMIYHYELVPLPLLNLAAIALPWFELGCGAALLVGALHRGAALLLLGANAVFMLGIVYRSAVIMGRAGTPPLEVFFDCGCGLGEHYAWVLLVRDALFGAAALIVLLGAERVPRLSVARLFTRRDQTDG